MRFSFILILPALAFAVALCALLSTGRDNLALADHHLNIDSDEDGFRDSAENYVGTAWNWECAGTPAANDEAVDSYPPDFDDDRDVDSGDLAQMASQRFGARAGDPDYNPRYDLNADGFIDISDFSAVNNRFGQTCVRRDLDGDGFLDGEELWMGTSKYWKCSETPAKDDEAVDSYPPDFDDDRVVDSADVGRQASQRYGALYGDPDYNPRHDLNANGYIDAYDQAAVNNHFGETCVRADTDSDGFLDGAELYVGTDPNRRCPATTAKNDEPVDAWPPDFDDDQFVDSADVASQASQRYGAILGDPDYNRRHDLNANGYIDAYDQAAVNNRFGQRCA